MACEGEKKRVAEIFSGKGGEAMADEDEEPAT